MFVPSMALTLNAAKILSTAWISVELCNKKPPRSPAALFLPHTAAGQRQAPQRIAWWQPERWESVASADDSGVPCCRA